ncbi:GH35 family beta-galactosidase [Sediminibacterium soli]|uniref:GH35 family beta-galactosidase n=1 Tax=Sediminibacterium soli TaxID=2698829 RepID=UPI00137B5B59|nr:DUF5597 domain-containing protein [Sediminibacterium soli]NCI45060.1 mannonate dehydratase [Sediminibacterium soli]
MKQYCLFFFAALAAMISNLTAQIPHLAIKAPATQLVVHGKPFMILGGELGNSTFTSVENMAPVWEKAKALNVNTLLAPVYWELIEPAEGKFEFGLLGKLIAEARKQDLKLVLLWFGSWKNSMSGHAPAWIKTNPVKYPRAKDEKGTSQEILSPFSAANLQADKNAFTALMQYLKETDGKNNTVIMVQPENEIGMLPSARDYHPAADKLFSEAVPAELMQYLLKNRAGLVPELSAWWKKQGYKTSGSWQEIFGDGYQADELFMAWHFARFTNEIVKAGKAVYPLPMFVNAALIRPGKIPGEYPSAGPLPHLMDIWKAAAPDIDMLSPDFYNPDFEQWNDLYTRQSNPLFIPEHRFDATVGPKALFAIGHYDAIGFSPFSIENGGKQEREVLAKTYQLLSRLQPLISAHQGQKRIDAVLLDKEKQLSTVVLGNYEFSCKNSYTLGWEAGAAGEQWDFGGAIIIQTAANEFYIAGSGVVITCKNFRQRKKNTGILKTEEGIFENGTWKVLKHLNGDQTHQGRHIRIGHGEYTIQKITLYDYE